MELWTRYKDWPYIPTGDGKTCRENPPPTHWVLQNVCIIAPIFRHGYVYSYLPSKQLVRKPVPNFEVVKEICEISDALQDKHLFRQSETADYLSYLIRHLRWACIAGPTPESMSIISPENLQPLIRALKKLKLLPEGLIALLERLSLLHGQLVY